MNSIIALKIYSLIKQGIIKTNAQFWREFSAERISNYKINTHEIETYLKEKEINIVCCFDDKFPLFPNNLKLSEKPFLFAFRGDISLLNDTSKNVTIIGLRTPSYDIIRREQRIINCFKDSNINIISGLALGCDTAAHREALKNGIKTIAFLPSTIEDIYPPQNRKLADEIVKKGGLIVTEYISNAKNKYETISRFVARDRLQAMFSKAVILVASYKDHDGDSGSRHAMNKAGEYGKQRFVMYDQKKDFDNAQMSLNRQYFEDGVSSINKNRLEILCDNVS